MVLNDSPDPIKFGRFCDSKPVKSGPASEHTRFRQAKAWKDFRLTMLERGKNRCELCNTYYPGKRSRMLQVHHHDPENYEVLVPEKFSLLCAVHHDCIEGFTSMIMGKNWQPPANIQEWWALIGHHLALPAREKVLGHLNQKQEKK